MTSPRILSYGLLGLPLAFAALPIYVHVPRYYAETAGMELALLGFILLATRLADAGIDPWLGWLADRVPRPTMVAVALLPFAVGFVALLNPPSEYTAAWLVGSLALTYVGFSAATVAYQAWGADVGDTSALRTRLTAAREGFGLLGVVIAAALPAMLASDLGEGIRRLAWILPPVLLVAAMITFSRVGAGQPVHAPAQPLLPSLRRVMADQAFRRLLAVFVANGIAAAVPATLFLFFVADVLQLEKASGPLLALYFIAGAAAVGEDFCALWPGGGVAGGDGPFHCRLCQCQLARQRRPVALCCHLPGFRAGVGGRPDAAGGDCCRSGRAPGAGRRLLRRLELRRQTQSGAGCRPGVAAARTARLCAGQQRGPAGPDLRLCPVAARLQGAGGSFVVALAPNPGDLK
jgi:MFS family permease